MAYSLSSHSSTRALTQQRTTRGRGACPEFLVEFRDDFTSLCLDVMHMEYLREMKVVILKVQANTGQLNQRLDANLPELLGVTNTRSLKDEW
jgi:hypothetical protein